MALVLDFGDLNGECFILGSEGEREEMIDVRVVAIPRVAADVPVNIMLFTDADVQAFWAEFVVTNYEQQVGYGVNAQDARRISYLRLLAGRSGMFKFNDTAGQHNVRYVDFAERVPTGNVVPDWNLDAAWRNSVRPKFMDMVCIMAYLFRVRGHHWTQEMNDRYIDVWHKCLYQEDSPGLGWNLICHNALHAIFPDDLDELWINAVNSGRCAGALIKRINAAPAGVASISALNSGVNDLKLVLPNAFVHMPEAVNHLNDVTLLTTGPANRWNGSVNRRFYNAANVRVDESLLSALASLILASSEQFAANSPLRNSMALRRIAGGAPITGAVISRMIRTAVNSDVAAEIFLPAAPPAQGQGQSNNP
jgi:hypothetical protein